MVISSYLAFRTHVIFQVTLVGLFTTFLLLFVQDGISKGFTFFCCRENRGFADLSLSLIGEALISVSQGWKDNQHIPNAVGWELNRGKKVPRCISLAKSIDPTRLAISVADLNLKLMRLCALPPLNINILSVAKCLLLGAGTLGCQVARMLMAWGVRKITLLDSGKVAMSNPLRQSLYTLDDCLNGGDFKASAAIKSLKRIFPAVEAEGVVMAFPMLGHPMPSHEVNSVLEDCRCLHDLIDSHDAVFLLTDTRESQWLSTLLCVNANKGSIASWLCVTALVLLALFVTSKMMGNFYQMDRDGEQRLGCYFCNDVVGPVDSTANCTFDHRKREAKNL